MNKIFNYFIENSFVVNLISGFVILTGVFCLSMMNRDLIPPLQFPVVNVTVSLFGGTPDEVEKFVTYPLEEALKNVVGVNKITSTSSNSLSRIRITYDSDFKQMDQAAENVRAQIEAIKSRLPENIRGINVTRAEVKETFLYWLGIEGFDQNKTKHRQFYKRFEKQLLKTPGVVRANSSLKERDVYIEFDQKKLDHYSLSTTEVRTLIRSALVISPVGIIDQGDEKIEVKLNNVVKDIDSLKNLTLRGSLSGYQIKLKDIARVEYKTGKVNSLKYINGKEGLSLGVRKDLNSDSFTLKDLVDKKINSFNKEAPDNIKIKSFLDGPQFIKTQISVLTQNGIIGFILVFFILILFLNFRTAVMTAFGLPLAYLGTFCVLYAFGLNIDLLSIIGMILVVGILVDDAIIVAEKYNDNLLNGQPPKQAANNAIKALIIPVTGTVLTTLVAFAPLIFIKSEISTILYAVPIVVITALLISWVESFFILPNHLAHFAKSPKPPRAKKLMGFLIRKYKVFLRSTLKFRYVAFILMIAVVGLAGFIANKKIKKDFNLRINAEYIDINATLKKSASLEDSYKQVKNLENKLMQISKDEITDVYTNIGDIWVDGKMRTDPKYLQISLMPNRTDNYPKRQVKRITPIIQKIIDENKSDIFEKIEITKKGEGQDEEKKQIVSLYISGSDEIDFQTLEKKILATTKDIKEIKEYSPDSELFLDSWSFSPSPSKLSLHQITPPQLSGQIRGYFSPDHLIETRLGGENLWVYTRLKERAQWKLNDLNSIAVLTPRQVTVPLALLGRWEKNNDLKKITHKNGERQFTMDFKVAESSTRDLAYKELKKSIEPLKTAYPEYNFSLEYLSDEEKGNQSWALKVALICIFGVMFILALILKSVAQPFIVGLPIPFGIVGIVLALYVHNLPMGLMALVGLVGTIGVSVNASIIMVDQINQLKKRRGKMDRDVLIDACASRLRAILLTTLTTLFGVFPMAYAFGGESGFTQPLAFSMAWGLSFSTILTLFILPALLEIREDSFKVFGFLKRKLFRKKEVSKVSINQPGSKKKDKAFDGEGNRPAPPTFH